MEEPYFNNSLEHLEAELSRLDLLVRALYDHTRRIFADDPYTKGLVIHDAEADAYLDKPAGSPRWAAVEPEYCRQTRIAHEAERQEVNRSIKGSMEREIPLNLITLAQMFSLSVLEVDILLLCLSVELDYRYQTIYAYLQDDVQKKHPTVDLMLELLCDDFGDKLKARAAFDPESKLLANQLIELFEEPPVSYTPLLRRSVRLDPRVSSFLIGMNTLDPRLELHVAIEQSSGKPENLILNAARNERLEALIAWFREGDKPLLWQFCGQPGSGKQTLAHAVCNKIGCTMVTLHGDRLTGDDGLEVVKRALREARMQGGALYWRGFDRVLEHHRQWLAQLPKLLENGPALVFTGGIEAWFPGHKINGFRTIAWKLDETTRAQRLEHWRNALNGNAISDKELELLATRFKFEPGRIFDTARTAKGLARRRQPQNAQPTMDELLQAGRTVGQPHLGGLAKKVETRRTWDDLILPGESKEQLWEIVNTVNQTATVLEDWGFGEKLSYGTGCSVLFSGPPGTGKTMAAGILGNVLGLDVYSIDLSGVVSKYIGETEKNISKIFDGAERASSILFFDEADAIFGKRSEVKDAHDRYANIETSYLLQRMEAYSGIVILATNLKSNMDKAFVRRLHYHILFPEPDEQQRREIWEGVWPQQTPLDPEVDSGVLAQSLEINGGLIRNIALSAAYLAAGDGNPINNEHLRHATRREYRKAGRVATHPLF